MPLVFRSSLGFALKAVKTRWASFFEQRRCIVGRKHAPEFEIIRIPKGKGGFRTIYKPRQDVKATLRGNIPHLEELALKACPPDVVHGFWPARSCVTNAAMHIGYEFTVCFDFRDFFDHCTIAMAVAIQGVIDLPAHGYLFPDGAARQGLPTSPAVSNICASNLDWALYDFCQATGIVYSRYADDLTFSANEWQQIRILLHLVPELAAQHGFEINERKTHTQCAKAGRRVITGVAVDDKGVYPTRKTRRKLRAAVHKMTLKPNNPHWKHRMFGLREWAKCKTPGLGKKARKAIEKTPEDALQIAAQAAQFPVKGDSTHD
jgi:hypothetical protein